MGRPRKYPLPQESHQPLEAPPVAAPAPDLPDEEPEESDEEPLPEELVDIALENRRMWLTPEMVAALNQAYRDNVRADDEFGKRRARDCADRLKRASHPELHPGCPRVTGYVPMLKNEKGS